MPENDLWHNVYGFDASYGLIESFEEFHIFISLKLNILKKNVKNF